MSKVVKLGDVFSIASGGTPNKKENSFYENGTIPWIKTGDLKNKYISNDIECITDSGLKNSSAKLFPEGTVLLAMYGATIGACSILPFEASTNQACAAFLPNDTILPQYLYYFLHSQKSKFIQDGVGGAQPNISAGYLKKVKMRYITIRKQEAIVETLNKVDNLILFRSQQLSKLDELVKSRFIEMFGEFIQLATPVNFESICEFVTVGIANSATHAFCDDGVIMFRNQNIKEDYLDTFDIVHITPDFASKYKSKMLKKDDLLIVRTGYPGVACLVPKKYEGCQTFTTLIARIKHDNTINPRFVCHYINSEYGKKYVRDNSAGAAQQNFGATALSKLPICIPPIELQVEYIEFVEQTDELKSEIKQSLEKLETLKKSLMQKYFG